MNPAVIDDYEAAARKLRASIEGLSNKQMLWVPPLDAGVGLWSIKEVVIHMMDSDLIGSDRMKRIAAEDNPLLIGYNEGRFASRLFYQHQSIEDALTLFEVNRRQFALVLRKLAPETFERTGIHNESGKVALGDQVKKYNEHLDHHLKFIAAKRAKMNA
jgi:hypothetical protein